MNQILAFVKKQGRVTVPEIVSAMKRPGLTEREIRATILTLKMVEKLVRKEDGSVMLREKVRPGSIHKLSKRLDVLIKEWGLRPPPSAQDHISNATRHPRVRYD